MNSCEDSYMWKGIGASAGVVVGTARIIHTNDDLIHVGDQDILIARHATPALYPSLVRARAAVCETGGRLCHLAVLAREMGKPCVTGLPGILDYIISGTQLRIDGTKGIVEVLTSLRKDISHPSSQQSLPEMVPIIQFGLFSKTFEYVGERFDIETAVRSAALVSLPAAFHVGDVWDFAVTSNQILVSRSLLQSTKERVVAQIEAGVIKVSEIHQKYFDICNWKGWIDISCQALNEILFRSAIHNYITLNQITWLACIVKEDLTQQYKNFLTKRLPQFDVSLLEQLFLNSLVMPGHSYILRCHFERDDKNVWSVNFSQDHVSGEQKSSLEPSVEFLVQDAKHRCSTAIKELRLLLDEQDFDRVLFYISTIASLVDLTERKNTDLYQCERRLFGKAANLLAISNFFDIETLTDKSGFDLKEDRKKLVQQVLKKNFKVSYSKW